MSGIPTHQRQMKTVAPHLHCSPSARNIPLLIAYIASKKTNIDTWCQMLLHPLILKKMDQEVIFVFTACPRKRRKGAESRHKKNGHRRFSVTKKGNA
mmetsp:Transcript_41163/g.62355  ORF Transcript_41163/g.62355 Transcript_41163/m.62355 type:complete len:97 (-) Transcript_41163:31-321(-)